MMKTGIPYPSNLNVKPRVLCPPFRVLAPTLREDLPRPDDDEAHGGGHLEDTLEESRYPVEFILGLG